MMKELTWANQMKQQQTKAIKKKTKRKKQLAKPEVEIKSYQPTQNDM